MKQKHTKYTQINPNKSRPIVTKPNLWELLMRILMTKSITSVPLPTMHCKDQSQCPHEDSLQLQYSMTTYCWTAIHQKVAVQQQVGIIGKSDTLTRQQKLRLFTTCMRVFTALHVMQTRYSEENSVRLSARPSVCHTRDHWQNGREICPYFYTIFILVFWEEEWLVGGDPFYLKFWVNRPPLERNRRFSTNNRS